MLSSEGLHRRSGLRLAALLALLALAAPFAASAQPAQPAGPGSGAVVDGDLVQLDFNDVELPVVIDTIARLTGKNFIYDDRVRGRVTIVSPTKITVDQAYAVFESVLQVKGFTVVSGPGGALKVIPIREAKETSIETMREQDVTPDSDRFVTRLIPLALHRRRGDHRHAEAAGLEGRGDGGLPADQHGHPHRLGVEHPAHPRPDRLDRRRDLQGGARRPQGAPRRRHRRSPTSSPRSSRRRCRTSAPRGPAGSG